MSPLREAVVLPLIFLTVGMFGGLEPESSLRWSAPSPFSLVLAVMLILVLVRSEALAPDRLMHGSRSSLANANGLVVLVALFAGSAQALHMLTPTSGLPNLIVALVLFLLLLNTLVSSPERRHVLRSLAVVLGSAFVLKFVILAALADPTGSRTRSVLTALFDAATLGTISQAPIPTSAAYLAFAVLLLYFIGIAALPGAQLMRDVPPSWPTGLGPYTGSGHPLSSAPRSGADPAKPSLTPGSRAPRSIAFDPAASVKSGGL